jgi:PIN like domain
LKFFFDNTMPLRVARATQALVEPEHEISHLRDRFDPKTPDPVWISELAEEGDWVVISGDVRITRNPDERKAWSEAGLVGFFLAKGWTALPLWEQAWRFFKSWPQIAKIAPSMRPPAGFIVHVHSLKFEQLRI